MRGAVLCRREFSTSTTPASRTQPTPQRQWSSQASPSTPTCIRPFRAASWERRRRSIPAGVCRRPGRSSPLKSIAKPLETLKEPPVLPGDRATGQDDVRDCVRRHDPEVEHEPSDDIGDHNAAATCPPLDRRQESARPRREGPTRTGSPYSRHVILEVCYGCTVAGSISRREPNAIEAPATLGPRISRGPFFWSDLNRPARPPAGRPTRRHPRNARGERRAVVVWLAIRLRLRKVLAGRPARGHERAWPGADPRWLLLVHVVVSVTGLSDVSRLAKLIAMLSRTSTRKKQAATRYVQTREGGYRPAQTPSIPTSMNGPQIRPIVSAPKGRPASGTPGPANSQT